MTARTRGREARREALQVRCAQQRVQLAESLGAIEQHLQPIDRTLRALKSVRRMHLLLGAIAALAALPALLWSSRRQRLLSERFAWLLPLAAPLLKLLSAWWQQRSEAAAHPLNEPPAPPGRS